MLSVIFYTQREGAAQKEIIHLEGSGCWEKTPKRSLKSNLCNIISKIETAKDIIFCGYCLMSQATNVQLMKWIASEGDNW